jgi:hypothetical protein
MNIMGIKKQRTKVFSRKTAKKSDFSEKICLKGVGRVF